MCGFSLGSRVQFFHVIALSWQGVSDFATSHLLPVPVLCYPVHVPRRLPRSRSVHVPGECVLSVVEIWVYTSPRCLFPGTLHTLRSERGAPHHIRVLKRSATEASSAE